MPAYKITVGNRSLPIRAIVRDPQSGKRIDIASYTATFRMVARRSGTVKVNDSSADNMQRGDGLARITGVSMANPVVITCSAAHSLVDGDIVYIDGANMSGASEIAGGWFEVANQATTTFELKGEDGTNYEAWASGGRVLTRGQLSYSLAAADVDTAGIYDAQFTLTDTGGLLEHVPSGPGLLVEIVAEL